MDKNINILYDYILHHLIKNDLIHKSNTNNINELYFPAGYDRFFLINQRDKEIKALNCTYTERIKNIEENNISEEEEEKFIDTDEFLKSLLNEKKPESNKSMSQKEYVINSMKQNEKIEVLEVIQEKDDINLENNDKNKKMENDDKKIQNLRDIIARKISQKKLNNF